MGLADTLGTNAAWGKSTGDKSGDLFGGTPEGDIAEWMGMKSEDKAFDKSVEKGMFDPDDWWEDSTAADIDPLEEGWDIDF